MDGEQLLDVLMDAVTELVDAKRQYDDGHRTAVEGDNPSWDWSGRAYDEVKSAKTHVLEAIRALFKDEVERALAEYDKASQDLRRKGAK